VVRVLDAATRSLAQGGALVSPGRA